MAIMAILKNLFGGFVVELFVVYLAWAGAAKSAEYADRNWITAVPCAWSDGNTDPEETKRETASMYFLGAQDATKEGDWDKARTCATSAYKFYREFQALDIQLDRDATKDAKMVEFSRTLITNATNHGGNSLDK